MFVKNMITGIETAIQHYERRMKQDKIKVQAANDVLTFFHCFENDETWKENGNTKDEFMTSNREENNVSGRSSIWLHIIGLHITLCTI